MLLSRTMRLPLDGESVGPVTLEPARPGGPVLVYALSGLGKSTLARAHPDRVRDADEFLYAAVAEGFPDLEPRARLGAWRELCGQRPWEQGGEALRQWAAIRRAMNEPLVAAMRVGTHRLVLTSLLDPPWFVSAYYGVEPSRYLEHLRLVGREPDNGQTEAMNNRLDGYQPAVRLAPGGFLDEQLGIRELLLPYTEPLE